MKKIKVFIVIAMSFLTLFVVGLVKIKAQAYVGTPYSINYSGITAANLEFNAVDDGYYVAETFGDYPTLIQVYKDGNLLTENSNGKGEGDNALVTFSGPGVFDFYIRRADYVDQSVESIFMITPQRALLSGFQYSEEDGPINTIPDLDKPAQYLSKNLHYYVEKITDSEKYGKSYYFDNIYPYHKRINAEVLLFSGHGSGIRFKTPEYMINASNIIDLSRTKLVVWSSCEGADSSSGTNTLFNRSLLAGAETVIAWPDTIGVSSSKTFTDRLFEYLSYGKTVQEACEYGAAGLLWPWDAVKDYVIGGNVNTTLYCNFYPTNENSVISEKELLINELKSRMNSEVFKCIKSNNGYRIYFTIDGYLTNDYYDVICEDNEIVRIYKSDYRISTHTLPIESYAFVGKNCEIVYVSDGNTNTPYLLDFNKEEQTYSQIINLYTLDNVY